MILSSPFATSLLNQNMESEIVVKHLQKNIEDLKSEQSALKEEINSLKNEQLTLKSNLTLVQEKYLKISNINQDSHKSK